MKVIDILNKIAKGEEVPKKIKCYDNIWTYEERVQDYAYKINGMVEKYFIQDEFRGYDATKKILDCKVEIIKEEKPKEIEKVKEFNKNSTRRLNLLERKINELIDKVNSISNKE